MRSRPDGTCCHGRTRNRSDSPQRIGKLRCSAAVQGRATRGDSGGRFRRRTRPGSRCSYRTRRRSICPRGTDLDNCSNRSRRIRAGSVPRPSRSGNRLARPRQAREERRKKRASSSSWVEDPRRPESREEGSNGYAPHKGGHGVWDFPAKWHGCFRTVDARSRSVWTPCLGVRRAGGRTASVAETVRPP